MAHYNRHVTSFSELECTLPNPIHGGAGTLLPCEQITIEIDKSKLNRIGIRRIQRMTELGFYYFV